MPNWCENELTLSGDVADVKQALQLIARADEEDGLAVDFELLKPMPQAFHGIRTFGINQMLGKYFENRLGLTPLSDVTIELLSASAKDKAEATLHAIKANKAYDSSLTLELFTEELLLTNLDSDKELINSLVRVLERDNIERCEREFGHLSANHWTSANWGTKSNAEMADTYISPDRRYAVFCFDTAWQAPTVWFESLSKYLHDKGIDVSLTLKYSEGNMWFGGYMLNTEDGTVETGEMTDSELRDIYGFDEEEELDEM